MSAYRGDTPYEADTFPGEDPIQGLYNKGQGQNRMALAESMGASKYKDLQAAGLGTLLQEPSAPDDPRTSLEKQLQAAGLTPGTPAYAKAITDYLSKDGGVQITNAATTVPGYTLNYDAEGRPVSMTPTPGGPVDMEMRQKAEAAQLEQQQAAQEFEKNQVKNTEFLNQIDKALDNNTFWTTGMVGKVLSFWSGSDASYQAKLLERIQGETALNRLAEAQAASKTGGVFGSLQKEELNLLKNSLQALEVGMSADQMEQGLNGLKEHRLKWEGYQKMWDANASNGRGDLIPEAKERNFGGFGRYLPDEGGVEILDKPNFELFQKESRTGIKQNYRRIGVYQ
jgi:hypothetical protein